MKLTVAHLYAAQITLTAIINRKAPMSQKGKYRIARMHRKLMPDFQVANEQRELFISAFGHREEGAENFSVPVDKMDTWHEFWTNGLAKETVEIDVQPIPLSTLVSDDANGSIEAIEIMDLDDLVYDDAEEGVPNISLAA